MRRGCWGSGEPIPCTVLDPFGGSGTTGQVALELGRRAVLVELNPDYVHLIHNRCATTMGLPLAV
jgi:DNA modification methylase